jgi:CspA family cold shock protein
MTGTIKKLTDKGFGFVSQEGGKDVFFHSKNLVGVQFNDLKEGQTLSYDIEDSPKGPNAVNIQLA